MTDSKNELDHKYNLDLKSQDVRIDSSFSIRTDYSMDIGVNNENPNSRKKKNQKDSSKVTFDDSLNTDLLYDRSISSIHPTKGETKKEKSKKQQEFISVYSGRPIENEQENNNKNTEKVEEPKQEQIQRKGSLNLEYKPEKPE